MVKASFGRKNAAPAKTETKPAVQVPATVETKPETYTPAAYVANDIGEYRGRFPEETKTLSDKALFDIVMGTADDMSDDDWKSLFLSRANPNAVDGDTLAEQAHDLGSKAGVIVNETATRLAKAKEDWQGGPIYTLLALRASYDETELDMFPVPGSETGHNPDRFSITTMKGDKKGTKKTTFYAQFTRATAAGKALVERLDWLERAADKGMVKDGIPEEILEMSPDQRDSERSFCENRINVMTQAYKKALELHFQLQKVNSYADNIVAEPIWQEGKSPDDCGETPWLAEVVPTNEPIMVYVVPEQGKPVQHWEHFSIGAFLKLSPSKATERGGGFRKLVESGATKKAPLSPGQAAAVAAAQDVTIKTVDRGLGVFVEAHRWLLEIMGSKDAADYGKLVNELTKKGNDEYVTSFVELKNALVDICKNNKLDNKYVALKEKGSDLPSDTKVPVAV